MDSPTLFSKKIMIKGGGDLATGVAIRLHASGFRNILIVEREKPLAVRRTVAFCEAVHDGTTVVEGITARLVNDGQEIQAAWQDCCIPVRVDPQWQSLDEIHPAIVVDAILAKKNLGTCRDEADLVIGMGPGFCAGDDVDRVIETMRGHDLGRVIAKGTAHANTGIPGNVGGFTLERILRAPVDGLFTSRSSICDMVKQGDIVGHVAGQPVHARLDGVIRGLIRDGSEVVCGLKIGDVDPRGEGKNAFTVSDKARAIGGGVLEAICAYFAG